MAANHHKDFEPQELIDVLIKRAQEIFFIFVVTIVLFLLLALASYNPLDPAWSHTGTLDSASNVAGIVGAYLADILLSLFGYIGYFVPVIFISTFAVLVKGFKFKTSIFLLGVKILGAFLTILSGCGLANMYLKAFRNVVPQASGGIIGGFVHSYSLMWLGNAGATLLLCAVFMVGITLVTNLSWSQILHKIKVFTLLALNKLKLTIINFIKASLAAIKTKVKEAIALQKEKQNSKAIQKSKENQSSKVNQNSNANQSSQKPFIDDNKKNIDNLDNLDNLDNRNNLDTSIKITPVISSSFIKEQIHNKAKAANLPIINNLNTINTANSINAANLTNAANATAGSGNPGNVYSTSNPNNINGLTSIQTAAPATLKQKLLGFKKWFGIGKQNNVEASSLANDPSSINEKNLKLDPDFFNDQKVNELQMSGIDPLEPNSNFITRDSAYSKSFRDAEDDILEDDELLDDDDLEFENENASASVNTNEYTTSTNSSQNSTQSRNQHQNYFDVNNIHVNGVNNNISNNINNESIAYSSARNAPNHLQGNQGNQGNAATANDIGTGVAKAPSLKNKLPNVELLQAKTDSDEVMHFSKEVLEQLSQEVEKILNDFGAEVKVVAVYPGPVITRFELSLKAGLKAAKISSLSRDIARSLSVSSVRIVEVIPGKSVVGLEIPNQEREIVRLKEIIESREYKESSSPITLALGKDISGQPVIANLAKMPHLLVAGTTGSGKSVGVNAMLLSILYKATPKDVRLLLIDPKMLELSIYESIPHLLAPVVTDMKDAANALKWCVYEMERRYQLMATVGVRNLTGFNHKVTTAIKNKTPLFDPFWQPVDGEKPPRLTKLPRIVVIIDEFADMIMVVGKKVEELIARIAQKARAAGIHMILATQRPSVDVITGLIKANIPTRIAFQVSSKIDSRTILDQQGAEQLLGNGDMLYLPPGVGVPARVHGAFVSDEEVHETVAFLRKTGAPDYVEDIYPTARVNNMRAMAHSMSGSFSANGGFSGNTDAYGEKDELYDEAVLIVTESRKTSVSNLQRRLKIGYNRAARLIEDMEVAGILSSVQATGVREVLVPPTAASR